MIYKVIDTSDVLISGLKRLNTYNAYMIKGCLFISDKNNDNNFYSQLKECFADSQIVQITEYNLIYECNNLIEWAKKEFVSADLIQYEKDYQDKLQKIMKQLDYVEQELFEGSEDECQMKKRSEEDLLKTKKISILTKIKRKLKWSKINL